MSEKVPGFDKLDKSEVINALMAEYTSLEAGYQVASTKRESDYKQYAMKPYGNEMGGRSKTVDSTIFDKVEWLTPNLVRPFVEGDEVIDVEPEDEDSVVASEYMREILTYQLKRRQSWYNLVHSSVKGALIWGQSYAKLHFEKDTGPEADFVRVEPVHPAEIRIDWDADDFYQSSVVIHDVNITASDLEKMKGNGGYDDKSIDEVLKQDGDMQKFQYADTTEQRERVDSRVWVGAGVEQQNKENKYYVLHEHYCNMDVDGSGKSVPVVASYINDQLIRFMKNPYPDKQPPFVAFQAVREPFAAIGWSMTDILGDTQRTRTSIKRDIEDNAASQANGMWEADMRYVDAMGIKLLRNGIAGSVVPTQSTGAIKSLAPHPIAPQLFNYLDRLSAEADMKSGYQKSAAMDSKMLGAKATSAEIVFNSGQMQIWEKAQRMLDSGFKVLLRKSIAYNQKWLGTAQLKKMFGPAAGEWMVFDKKDIGGRLNATLNISLASDKAEKINKYMQAFQMASQQAATMPNAAKMAEFAMTKVFDLMGAKEMRSFLEDDKDVGGTGGATYPGELGVEGAGADALSIGALEGINPLENLAGVDAGNQGLALDESGLGAESLGGTV